MSDQPTNLDHAASVGDRVAHELVVPAPADVTTPDLASVLPERRGPDEDRAEAFVRCLAAAVLDGDALTVPRDAMLEELHRVPSADREEIGRLRRNGKCEP